MKNDPRGHRAVVASPAPERATARRGALIGTSLLAALVILAIPVVTVTAAGPEPYEQLRRGFPGLDVAVAAAVLRAVAELSSIVTIGALTTTMFIGVGTDRMLPRHSVPLLLTRAASITWATAAGLLIVIDGLDAGGVAADQLMRPGAWSFLYDATYPPKAWTVTALAAALIVLLSQLATRWTTMIPALWAATLGVLAPVVVGQVLVGVNHDIGSDVAVVQTLAVAVLLGTLLVAAAQIGTGHLLPPATLRRLALLAAVLLPVIAASEVVLAWFKLAGTGPGSSATGAQVLARCGVLALMGAGLLALRRAARAGRLRESHLASAATVATMLVALWCGVTVAMTRIPPPHYFIETSIQQVYFGFEALAPPGLRTLLTHWRPNILFCVLALAALAAYLLAVGRLRGRGDAWPAGRTVAWVSGCLLLVLATSSGVGRYSGTDLGVHMGVHMVLAMLAPLLLTLGGAMTLMLRALPAASAPHTWLVRLLGWRGLRVMLHPVLVLAVFVGSYYALYLTDLFGDAMRFHWAHQLMNLHFLGSGYLYYSLVIGVDRMPVTLPHIGRLAYLLAAMPFHAFFGVILMTSERLVAQDFYEHLDLPWADLLASQELAGGIAWAGGELPLVFVVVVLAVQWARQDDRAARRHDRAEDAGLDHELAAYNQMLDKLARRDSSRATRPSPVEQR